MKIIFKDKNEFLNTLYGDEEDYSNIPYECIKDIIKEKLKALDRIYDYLSDTDMIGEEQYDLGDCENLIQLFENIEFEKDEDKRICSECGKEMTEGYCIDNGMEYYCSNECLHKNYTEEEYNDLYDNGNGDTYWTSWEE